MEMSDCWTEQTSSALLLPWLVETCCLPVRLLSALARRAGKYDSSVIS